LAITTSSQMDGRGVGKGQGRAIEEQRCMQMDAKMCTCKAPVEVELPTRQNLCAYIYLKKKFPSSLINLQAIEACDIYSEPSCILPYTIGCCAVKQRVIVVDETIPTLVTTGTPMISSSSPALK